mmetsp:Transcript_122293/g.212121  ORF Transcript_122293/g.212121 Transcript_122293/m.212121 type:complete len:217 (-) Transcript_122293:77-727(-)
MQMKNAVQKLKLGGSEGTLDTLTPAAPVPNPSPPAAPVQQCISHPVYKPDYWLQTSDFVNIMVALLGPKAVGNNKAVEAPSTPGFAQYKLRQLQGVGGTNLQRRERKACTEARWNHIICNTTNTKGVHWVFMVYRLVPTFELHILDPYENTANLTLIRKLFPSAHITGMGHQAPDDWWRCGYIVLWWHLFSHVYVANCVASTDVFDPTVLPQLPAW